MKTKKLWIAAALLSGAMSLNAQTTSAVENSFETGYGLQNGAVNNLTSETDGAVFFGYQAGFNTTTKLSHGGNNSFIGHKSGYANTLGYSNTFLGSLSGDANISGYQNVFIGHDAGSANNDGFQNVFIGQAAGFLSTTGDLNTFTGYNSGKNNTANNNTFYGHQSGLNNTTGTNNTFVGISANKTNTIGSNNTSLGSSAGIGNTTGNNNTYIGSVAGSGNGSNNTCVGVETGMSSTGSNNTYIGNGAGSENSGGSSNTFIGNYAGFDSNGSNNVFIGPFSGSGTVENGKLRINNNSVGTSLVYGDFLSKKLAIGGINDFSTTDNFPTTASGVNVANYKLFVKGGILTEEVRIALQTTWADYVFADGYKLLSLPEVEQFISKNGHLPNVPSAKQIKEEGMAVGEITVIQQEKIEELTLYVIEQNKQLEKQQKEIDELKAAVKALAGKKQ